MTHNYSAEMYNLIKNIVNYLHFAVTITTKYLINYYTVSVIFVMFCVIEYCTVLITFTKLCTSYKFIQISHLLFSSVLQ